MPKHRHRRRKPLIPGFRLLVLLAALLTVTLGWYWILASATTFHRTRPPTAQPEKKP